MVPVAVPNMTRVAARCVGTQASGAGRMAIFESIEVITVFAWEVKWSTYPALMLVGMLTTLIFGRTLASKMDFSPVRT